MLTKPGTDVQEEPIRLVVPEGKEKEDQFFQTLFDLGKHIEEFGAFVTIIRAEHWRCWWLDEANRLARLEGPNMEMAKLLMPLALENADAWNQFAHQWEVGS